MPASLQDAIEKNDKPAVHVLAQDASLVNARMENGLTPLQYAAARGAADCVRMLLYEGAKPSLSYTGLKPLGQAAVQGHADCLEILMAGGASLEPISLGNALVMAARAGHADCVRVLLEVGTTDEYLYQALKSAVTQGHTDCAAMLATECTMMLEEDEDLEDVIQKRLKDEALLQFALRPDVLELLRTPHPPVTVRQAVCLNDEAAMNRLLAEVASLCMNRADTVVPSSMYYAVEYAVSPVFAELLIAAGGAPDKPLSSKGKTPLMYALRNGDTACIKLLLQHGAELFVCGRYKWRVWDCAGGNDVQLLLNAEKTWYKKSGIKVTYPPKQDCEREKFMKQVATKLGVTWHQKLQNLVRLLKSGVILSDEPVVLKLFRKGMEKELFDECGELLAFLQNGGMLPHSPLAKKIYKICLQHEQSHWAEHLRNSGMV